MSRNDWKKRIHQSKVGLENAFKLMVGTRFTPPYEAPYTLALQEGILRLRHYTPHSPTPMRSALAPVLLVPPLMVTSQIYDISPDLSCINQLLAAGCDVWITDFGIPEREPGGMNRTLDDHILAISKAIDHIHNTTGKNIHLLGYSQGGMFAYQVAAYRQSQNMASVVTFGSPVDLRRNVPGNIHSDLVQRFFSALRTTLGWTLNDLQGIPGHFSSLGFKLASPRQEIRYLRLMLGMLDDHEALSQLEPTRRFLGGEGFIAWPGPALRSFIQQIVIENRMTTGGLVVAGRTITLADITCPILYFVGFHDEFARPSSVRAIAKVAVDSQIYERGISAGHFGLVVGSRARTQVWPVVLEWFSWISGLQDRPTEIKHVHEATQSHTSSAQGPSPAPSSNDPAPEPTQNIRSWQTMSLDLMQDAWERLGESALDATAALGWMRWQTPRLLRLLSMTAGFPVSLGRILAEQAQRIPEQTFFLWKGRAYSYRDANHRVNQVLHALIRVGVRPRTHIGIFMNNHPDYLTALAALNRMGCVAVLLNPGNSGQALIHAAHTSEISAVITDIEHAAIAQQDLSFCKVLILGHRHEAIPTSTISLDQNLRDHEITPPHGIIPDAGRPDDVALHIFTSGTTGLPKAAKITNRRWMLGATVATIGGGLTPNDTVYCCLPLFHGSGLILAAGSALLGGCRLALATKFSTSNFWKDVRNCGASVVFYIGEMCRYLTSVPEQLHEKKHPVRLFIGNGLQQNVWEEMLRRFGNIRIMEFYAATEGNTFMINFTGEKIGSVGRVPLSISTIELVKYDVENDTYLRTPQGFLIPCDDNEPGMMLSQIVSWNPTSRFDGYTDPNASNKKILHNVFQHGDSWFVTGDFLRRDEDGDYWFVDRLGDTFRWKGENVSTDQVTKLLSHVPFLSQVAVYGIQLPGHEGRIGMASAQLQPNTSFDGSFLFQFVEQQLMPAARPQFIRIVDNLSLTDTFKIKKFKLQQEGADPTVVTDPLYVYNAELSTYSPLSTQLYTQILPRL